MNAIKKCIVSLDSLAGDSQYWKAREDELRREGYQVTHVTVFDEKRPSPTFWDFSLPWRGPDKVAMSLDWAAQLKKIDKSVGHFKNSGCAKIFGLGIGIGANFLLLFRDGRYTNRLQKEGGWFPELKNSNALTAIAGANPHAEYPEPLSKKGIFSIDIPTVTQPTYLIFGKEGAQTVPMTKTKGWIKVAEIGNKKLRVDLVEGAEYMFMLKDLPPMPFGHSPYYNEEAEKKSWQSIKSWLANE